MKENENGGMRSTTKMERTSRMLKKKKRKRMRKGRRRKMKMKTVNKRQEI